MADKPHWTAAEFIAVIPGTGGIVSTIAKRIGCDWHTAKKYITEHPTVKQAYDNEHESMLDMSEGVVFGNIRLAAKEIAQERKADTDDAKWVLSRLGKDRGYAERKEVDLNGQEIIVTIGKNANKDE